MPERGRATRIGLVGLSGVGKSTLAARLRRYLADEWTDCVVLKLADPLYRIQRHYYETARVGVPRGQDQALLAAIATDLRRLSARALLDDFLGRLREVPDDVAVINDDLRDPDVDAEGLRTEGFVLVRITCPEGVRRSRLAGRPDVSRIDELARFGPDLDRLPVEVVVDSSAHSVDECVRQVLSAAGLNVAPSRASHAHSA